MNDGKKQGQCGSPNELKLRDFIHDAFTKGRDQFAPGRGPGCCDGSAYGSSGDHAQPHRHES
jgi:hypothetical protein